MEMSRDNNHNVAKQFHPKTYIVINLIKVHLDPIKIAKIYKNKTILDVKNK